MLRYVKRCAVYAVMMIYFVWNTSPFPCFGANEMPNKLTGLYWSRGPLGDPTCNLFQTNWANQLQASLWSSSWALRFTTSNLCILKPEEYATCSDTLAAWPYSWLQYHSIISDIPPQNLCTICIHLPRWSWSRASTLWKGLVVHRGHLCSTVVPSFLCWFLSNLV
jgi:hypothetical protein